MEASKTTMAMAAKVAKMPAETTMAATKTMMAVPTTMAMSVFGVTSNNSSKDNGDNSAIQ